MPRSYNDWLKRAEETINRFTHDGIVAHKVELDVDEFIGWAKGKDLPINGHLRSEFASHRFAQIWVRPDAEPSAYPDRKKLKEMMRAVKGMDLSEIWEPFLRRPKATVCPIFRESAIGPEQIGSGVLMRIHGAHFLITAAHVTDERKNTPLLVPSVDGFINLFGLFIESKLPESGRRRDDRIDVACVRLDQKIVDNLHPDMLFLDTHECDPTDVTQMNDAYTIIGFPSRKSGKDGRNVFTEQFSLSGDGVTDGRFERLHFDRTRHLLIQHRFKRAVNWSAMLRTPPSHPEGMSGGGIFAWDKGVPKLSALAQPKLVAIVTEYHPEHNVFVGTRIQSHLRAIYSHRDANQ